MPVCLSETKNARQNRAFSYSVWILGRDEPQANPNLRQASASTSPSNACAVTSGPAPGPWITSGCAW